MRLGVLWGVTAVVCLAAVGAAHAEAAVDVDPGNGVTVSSQDGETKINIGFYGQFRFQYLDQD